MSNLKKKKKQTSEEYLGYFCAALQSPSASIKQHSTLGNFCRWCNFRLLNKLQGDDAFPSKKQHLEKKKKQSNIQIYYDFLNLFMYLVSFSFYSGKTLTQLFRNTPLFV